ncbi:hypothetical protein K488DRAFT_82976 [Vararia minispora EC-137]|uniref:Uncharacterized protein n=1 Tax=Vararia minispora EC-137 TaxID=1314806 RepID=A0ACB8QVG6_9AGAM|nr:hypothetical protein K488DRAFT_82976 [Vararia minispora EC-137]
MPSYGLLALQTYNYSVSYRRDLLVVRATVYGVFISETLLNIVTTRVAYALLCSGWGDVSALLRLEWTDAFIPVLTGLVSGWVQLFYAWRIYVLGGRAKMWKMVAALIVPVASTSSVAALYSGFSTITDRDISVINTIEPAILLWLVCSVVCDFIIAISMIFVVRPSHRQATEPIRSCEAIGSAFTKSSIIRLTVETCLLTVTGAVIMLVFFLTLKRSRLFTMMGFITSKLYANSILVSLNSRTTGTNGTPTVSENSTGTHDHSLRVHVPSTSPRRQTTVTIVTPLPTIDAMQKGDDMEMELGHHRGKAMESVTVAPWDHSPV